MKITKVETFLLGPAHAPDTFTLQEKDEVRSSIDPAFTLVNLASL